MVILSTTLRGARRGSWLIGNNRLVDYFQVLERSSIPSLAGSYLPSLRADPLWISCVIFVSRPAWVLTENSDVLQRHLGLLMCPGLAVLMCPGLAVHFAHCHCCMAVFSVPLTGTLVRCGSVERTAKRISDQSQWIYNPSVELVIGALSYSIRALLTPSLWHSATVKCWVAASLPLCSSLCPAQWVFIVQGPLLLLDKLPVSSTVRFLVTEGSVLCFPVGTMIGPCEILSSKYQD